MNWLGDRAPISEKSAYTSRLRLEGKATVKLKYPEVLFAKDDAKKLTYVLRDEFKFGIVRAGNYKRFYRIGKIKYFSELFVFVGFLQ